MADHSAGSGKEGRGGKMADFSAVSTKTEGSSGKKAITIKVGLLGESQIGKTSLMVQYVEGMFEEAYIETLGVHFMDKTVSLRQNKITFNIWDLGGQKTFMSMLPLVCRDAVVILFMFDLTRKSTLTGVKDWYRKARGHNKAAIPFLVGTKYDQFKDFETGEKGEITKLARKYAQAMKAPLIFCSSQSNTNVDKIFKIVLCKAFKLQCNIPQISQVGEPILEYENPGAKKKEIGKEEVTSNKS
mmetsp:Transcript_18107/g.51075  ORF Transcript_18107/g.51075 Transcript_18107/m.51075 type:complete len:243 (+) Transcript_18107:165-893(+)